MFFKNLGFYTLIIALSIFIGGILPLFKRWHRRHLHWMLSLAAGILLGSAFFHLLPEAYEILGNGLGIYVLLGFLFLLLIERFVTVHLCEVLECEVHRLSLSAFLGVGLHNLTNGIALGSGLMFPDLGFVVFLAIASHKAPEAFSLSSIFLHGGLSRTRIILFHLFILLAVPLGALLVYSILQFQQISWMGRALAFSVGNFLYISTSDLLPEAHRHSPSRLISLGIFLVGLLLMWGLSYFFKHHSLH